MKRRLFSLLATVSLVLCVAAVVQWIRSYGSDDLIAYCGQMIRGGNS